MKPAGNGGGSRLPVLLAAALAIAGGPADGYRFYSDGDEPDLPPASAAEALRWSPEIWGPGEELSFFVADDPEWSETSRSAQSVLSFVERALAVWARIPSADIRWSAAGVQEGPGVADDSRNGVTANEDPETGFSFASIWWERESGPDGDGPWRVLECDVVLSRETARQLDDWGLAILIHEFGHCIGLAHAATYPGSRFGERQSEERSPSDVWRNDPQMSYGWSANDAITEDDRIGASLLRPAAGWPASTGAVGGEVLLDGTPARHVHVLAVASGGGTAGGGIGAFTDSAGRFLIEGLPPGDYLLWVHPLRRLDAHENMVMADPPLEVRDRLYPFPVTVRAGEAGGGRRLAVSAGRAP